VLRKDFPARVVQRFDKQMPTRGEDPTTEVLMEMPDTLVKRFHAHRGDLDLSRKSGKFGVNRRLSEGSQ
jgi:hypothetical protein